MSQAGFAQDTIRALRPKGFKFVVGLCIFIGAMGIVSRTALWLSPNSNFLSSQLTASTLVNCIQSIFDVGYLLGGIFVFNKRNWARILILVVAAAKILDWLYAAIVFRWMFSVNSLVIWALIPLIISVVIVIYFSRLRVKAYME